MILNEYPFYDNDLMKVLGIKIFLFDLKIGCQIATPTGDGRFCEC